MLIDINMAVRLLHQEKVVAVPTETVYGLAGRYDSESAIKTIFQLKNRPLDHPLIVHIGNLEWLNTLTKDYPTYVNRL
jgi:L-threonylcarbamoyladenylate synthase